MKGVDVRTDLGLDTQIDLVATVIIGPDSLCFECHPENAEKFVALYEAKYGKKPPEPTE